MSKSTNLNEGGSLASGASSRQILLEDVEQDSLKPNSIDGSD